MCSTCLATIKCESHLTLCVSYTLAVPRVLQVESVDELTEEAIIQKLRACGGAHQPTGYEFSNYSTGGSSGGSSSPVPPAAAAAPVVAAPPAAPVAAPPAAPVPAAAFESLSMESAPVPVAEPEPVVQEEEEDAPLATKEEEVAVPAAAVDGDVQEEVAEEAAAGAAEEPTADEE
jgi:hypothetical protein